MGYKTVEEGRHAILLYDAQGRGTLIVGPRRVSTDCYKIFSPTLFNISVRMISNTVIEARQSRFIVSHQPLPQF